jgi:hypothetical protein
MSLTPLAISWAVLAAIVLMLAIYRSVLASHEDETVHISDTETAMIQQQVTAAGRLNKVDRVGKSLTVVVVVYGLAIASVWIYQVWQQSGKAAMNG